MKTENLDRRALYIWVAASAMLAAVFGGIIAAVLARYTSLAWGLLVLFAVLGAAYGWKRYLNWGYSVEEDHLYIEHGVLKKTRSMVPFVRVQHIDTDRGPLERVLGLSTLRVYTAGSRGADIKVPGLEREDASRLQESLRDSAIDSEKGYDAV